LLQDQRYIEWAGQTARALTNKSADALRLDFSFLEQRQEADYRRLGEMLDYLTTEECRRAAILRYFGERVPVGHNCGACDVCHAARPSSRPTSGTLDVRALVLAAVRDLQKRGLGRSGLAQVLAGSQSRRMKQLKLDTSPHFAKLTRLTQEQIIAQIDSLISSGVLHLTPGPYPAVVMAKTPTAGTPAREPAQSPQEKISATPAAHTRPALDHTIAPVPTPNLESRTPNSQPQPLDLKPQTPDVGRRTPDATPPSPFDPLPVAVGWAILRVVETQDGRLPRSGVVHFLRGTTDMGARPSYSRTTLPGFRFLAQYPHQDLLRAVDLLVERKLLVVEATEHLHLWLTQRGKAALELSAREGKDIPTDPPTRNS